MEGRESAPQTEKRHIPTISNETFVKIQDEIAQARQEKRTIAELTALFARQRETYLGVQPGSVADNNLGARGLGPLVITGTGAERGTNAWVRFQSRRENGEEGIIDRAFFSTVICDHHKDLDAYIVQIESGKYPAGDTHPAFQEPILYQPKKGSAEYNPTPSLSLSLQVSSGTPLMEVTNRIQNALFDQNHGQLVRNISQSADENTIQRSLARFLFTDAETATVRDTTDPTLAAQKNEIVTAPTAPHDLGKIPPTIAAPQTPAYEKTQVEALAPEPIDHEAPTVQDSIDSHDAPTEENPPKPDDITFPDHQK